MDSLPSPGRRGARQRALLLPLMLTVVTGAVLAITVTVLYRTAYGEQLERLDVTVRSQARLIEASSRFDMRLGAEDLPGGAVEASLAELRDALGRFDEFGETGEFTVARHEGDSILFLLRHRQADVAMSLAIPMTSDLAGPMRRALAGESGTMTGKDYRGDVVLAAFEHIQVDGTTLGLVAKIDRSEVRAPFIATATRASGFALVLILAGILGFRRVTEPLIRDIEEGERTFRRLFQESEDGRFRSLAEESPSMIFIWQRGAVQYMNRRCSEIMGYRPKELLSPGFDVLSLFAPESVEVARQHWRRHLAGEEIPPFQCRLRTKKGRLLDAVVAGRPVSLQGAGAILGVVTDVTEHRKATEALRQERARAQRYLDVAQVMLLGLDTELRISMVNRAGLAVLGYESEDELLGRSWMDACVPEGARAEMGERFTRLMSGAEEEWSYHENPVLMRSGDERVIAWHTSVLRDEEGKVEGTLSSGVDITERQALDEALRISEAQYRDLVETSHDLVWRCAMDGRFMYVNPAWERSLGYAPDEMLERAFTEFLRPDRVETFMEEFRRIREGGSVEGHETVHVGRDGSDVHVVINAQPVWDAAGRVVCVQGTAYDVTERKRAEEAERASQERFRSTFEQAAVGIAHATLGRQLVRVNRKYSDILGYEPEELLGRTFMEFTHPGDVSSTAAELGRLLEGETDSVQYEKRYVRRSGDEVWVRMTVSLARGLTGEPEYYIGVAEDITERRRTGEELRSIQRQTEAILAAVPDMMFQVRSDGTFLGFFSGLGMELLTPPETFLGANVGDVLPADLTERIQSDIGRAIDRGEVTTHEYALMMGDERRWYEYRMAPLGEDEVLVVIRDVTARTKAEEAVRESNEMLRHLTARLHEVREEERAGIARELHDELGQALTAIRIDLITLGQAAPVAIDLDRRVGGLVELVDRSLESVQAMSARLRSPILDVLGLEAAVEWQAEEFATRTGVACRVDLEPVGLPVGDPLATAAFRIFQESLTNVARHAGASRVDVRVRGSESHLEVDVIDDGTGIEEEALGSHKSLGLIGMRERAMSLGGTVEVSAAPDGGTRVRAILPLSRTGGER